jgi:transketolase
MISSKINYLSQKSKWVWNETLKIHKEATETRIASSISPIEIFVTLFYGNILNFFPKDPLSKSRDRFVISKGHGSISMYPILSDLGFINPTELTKVCKRGGILGGIPDPTVPGYETINGSLGHGLGVAAGMALALKRKNEDNSVFVLVGDGELHEGSNWEAIMFANHHELDNLNVIVDNNGACMLGLTNDVLSHNKLDEKFTAFGWDCQVVNGHDVNSLFNVFSAMKIKKTNRPKVIIAETIKGRGLPGIENKPLAHIMNPSHELIDSLLDYDTKE